MSSVGDIGRLVNAEANARIASQIALLCSSDARATGLLAGSASIAGIALAAGLVLISQVPIASACFAMAFVAALSSLASLWAIWPVPVDLPGWKPASFEQDWSKSEDQVLQEMLPFVHDKIEDNDVLILQLYRRSLIAMSLLVVSPVAGAITWGVWLGTAGRVIALLALFAAGLFLFLTFVPERYRRPR